MMKKTPDANCQQQQKYFFFADVECWNARMPGMLARWNANAGMPWP